MLSKNASSISSMMGVHAADAGVVDQDIDAAERLVGGRNRGLHLGDDPVVGLQAQRLDLLALELRLGGVEIVLLEVGDRHLRAARGQHARMRQAQPVLPPVMSAV